MPALDNYLVTMGIKGQNVVLAQMDKIQKKGKNLSKSKTTVDLASKAAGKKSVTEKPAAEKATPGKPSTEEKNENEKYKRSRKQENEDEKKNTSKFREAVGRFGQGAQTIASSASSIDPVGMISGMTSAIGTSLSGISILGFGIGRLPEGIAAITNSMLTMAKNSVDMAKQSTAAYHALATRNAAAEHYGGSITQSSSLSRNERAMFIDAVSGSMGKIQGPLAEQINDLIGSKDTRALARAAAGDWESTGTDKGWMLGQISSGFQGLPPSIKQRIQASLLKNFSGEIQDMDSDRAMVQRNNAKWEAQNEDHTQALYKLSATGEKGAVDPNLIGISKKLNTMQEGLYTAGLKMAEVVDEVADTIAELPDEMRKFKKTLKDLMSIHDFESAAKASKSLTKDTPRALR